MKSNDRICKDHDLISGSAEIKKSRPIDLLFPLEMVLRAGLEPARIAPHAPQTCAATNYATSAKNVKNYWLAGAVFALDAGSALCGA